jgi:hypothetical protein
MLRALATIGESTSILAHEIKNPITAVNLALKAVADRLGEDQQEVLGDLVQRRFTVRCPLGGTSRNQQEMKPGSIRLPAASVATLLAAALLACEGGPSSASRPITREREWLPVGRPLVSGRSSAERFGFNQHPSTSTAPALTWTTPPGWRELPPSSMRVADFLVAGDERTECYLTVFSGDGGGLLANVNRWRGQMSLPAVDAEALATAPRAPLLGAEGIVVDLQGVWVGMGGDEALENYRLVGVLSIDGPQSRFLKMTGPAEVLASEVDAFLSLAASFREDGPRDGLSGSSADPDRSTSGLTWTAPASWRLAAERPMREVTFLLGENGEGECYVTVLAGTGGGALANVNRWRGQMGQRDLSSSAFGALLRIPMLGTEGVVLEVDGTYRGMGDELVERASLLGAVCELPGRAVFVKLIAPKALARAARDDFLSFCASLGQGE